MECNSRSPLGIIFLSRGLNIGLIFRYSDHDLVFCWNYKSRSPVLAHCWGKILKFCCFFLAHLVMSLCNHALSIVCHCHCRRCHWHQHWHLCTGLPVTCLIIEASYLTNICSYAPSICT